MSEPVVLESAVREVTVFRSGAIVTRVAELSGSWPQQIAFEGLPLALGDDSVRVSLTSDESGAALPRPADVRTELATPSPGAPQETPAAELEACEQRAKDLRRKIARVNAELSELRRVSLDLPEPPEDGAPGPAPAVAWRSTLAWLAEAKRARWTERTELDRALHECGEEQGRIQRLAQEERAQADARADAVSKRVVLRLRGPQGSGKGTLRLEYHVPGARWVPSYVLRMARDGQSAELGLRAHVIQASDEAWERVKLSLSTANLRSETKLPELSSLRIGRRQPAKPKPAWREPPTGSETLFEGLDRVLPPRPLGAVAASVPPRPSATPSPPPRPEPSPELFDSGESVDSLLDDEVDSRSMSFGAAPAPSMDEAPRARKKEKAKRRAGRGAPSGAVMRSAAAPMRKQLAPSPGGSAGGGGGYGEGFAPPSEPDPEPMATHLEPEVGLLRYGDLVLGGWSRPKHERGKLRATTWQDRLQGLGVVQKQTVQRRIGDAIRRARSAGSLALPPATVDVGDSSGDYDYRYDAEGRLDVPCDGAMHNVPLLSRGASVTTTLVVVPRESTQAVRVAHLENPLQAPLLAGPADVYLEDEFLVTTRLKTVPLGGRIEVGLGVEEALKVARNAHMKEESHGMLGGGRSLIHSVELEIASRLSATTAIEVRERVPVQADEDEDVEVVDVVAEPEWEVWKQDAIQPLEGGRRWLLSLAPGEERKLTFGYTIKIDAKNELVGGNRREA